VKEQTTYRDAGVNIDEADRAVSQIKRLAAKTFTPNVLTSIGSFGAGFSLKGWRDPVLVSSADGVGTKLKIAFATGCLSASPGQPTCLSASAAPSFALL